MDYHRHRDWPRAACLPVFLLLCLFLAACGGKNASPDAVADGQTADLLAPTDTHTKADTGASADQESLSPSPDVVAPTDAETTAPDDTSIATDSSNPDASDASTTDLATGQDISDAQAADSSVIGDISNDGSDSAAPQVTTIRVHYDSGYHPTSSPQGALIALRGDGVGLSWDGDSATTWQSGNIWEYSSTAFTKAVEFKPVLTGGALKWAIGPNYLVQPGQTIEIYPFFFNKTGSVQALEITSSTYGYKRSYEVYLPPSYNEPGAQDHHYPIVVALDGQNMFNNQGPNGGWHVDTVLNTLYVAESANTGFLGGVREVIVIAPYNGYCDRLNEYTPTAACMQDPCDSSKTTCGGGADKHLDFILNELVPLARATYRATPGKVGIYGSSLGGLLAFYACWSRPEAFDRCGAFSPSFWWDAEWSLKQIENDTQAKRPIVLYLDGGTLESAAANVTIANTLLKNKGYLFGEELLCLIGADHKHEEPYWTYRAPWAFALLYRDPTRVQPTTVPLPNDLSYCK